MLLKQKVLKGIADGSITLAFRRWKRPTVKTGGTLRTTIGVLGIESVEVVDATSITDREARKAGYDSKQQLVSELRSRPQGKVYRIALHHVGADPRHELRQRIELTDDEIDDLRNRMNRMDARSHGGPWTMMTLNLIATRPCQRAPDLAESAGMETKRFKANVRKLKELGLTESLKVGYRLSPRGQIVFERLRSS